MILQLIEDRDPADALHILLDAFDAPSVAVLMTGVPYSPNFNNPRTKVPTSIGTQ